LEKAKRKREGEVQNGNDIFKRDNKTIRSPPVSDKRIVGTGPEGEKREGDGDRMVLKKNEEDGSMMAILREINAELKDMKMEMKGMKERMSKLEEGWTIREKRLEDRMDKLEVRLRKMEQSKEDIAVDEKGAKIEEIVGRVTELVKKSERSISDKRERRNKFVIRGLQKEDSRCIRETADISGE